MLLVGTNSSVNAGKAGKITTGQQSNVTKSSHPVTNKTTTHQSTTGTTKSSTGGHSVTTSKAAGYPAIGANRGTIGGFPTVIDNTKTTSHLPNDVTTKAVNKEDHHNNRIDQGMYIRTYILCVYIHGFTSVVFVYVRICIM